MESILVAVLVSLAALIIFIAYRLYEEDDDPEPARGNPKGKHNGVCEQCEVVSTDCDFTCLRPLFAVPQPNLSEWDGVYTNNRITLDIVWSPDTGLGVGDATVDNLPHEVSATHVGYGEVVFFFVPTNIAAKSTDTKR